MKIIHSFWTKPVFEKGDSIQENRKSGGWIDRKFHYMSWALSCLQFKKHYGYIELVTDKLGKQLLYDKLKLPYDKVLVELDIFNKNSADLWALPKLYTYSLQKEPFLHVDGDVYIWKRLKEIEKKPLVAQNEDIGFSYYNHIWNEVLKNFRSIPKYMLDDFQKYSVIKSTNAGVFGGTDVQFIKEFVQEAFNFIERNQPDHHLVNLNLAGLIYEQYLFSCLARSKSKTIEFLFNSMSDSFREICQFSSIPKKRHYVHMVGGAKKNDFICDNMSHQLLIEYPDYYYFVLELIEKCEL